MALHVHNTLTKQRELFVPAQPKVVRIYTCGLTVYAPMHIGHARTYCFWDVFRRYLEYRNYHVISVINYTDIDDRIMKRAVEQGLGPVDFAERNIAGFRADCKKLHIKDYAVYTRATDFVDEQVGMVKQLIERGHAYTVENEVLYSVESYAPYGQLSGQKLEDHEVDAAGRLAEDISRKKHPSDFSLWKPTDAGDPTWQTGQNSWPAGRPGWHIECSAMSTALLGNHFDVHGGGIDNMFPHHENEIAQSEPLCGRPWVRYWLHPNHLMIAGKLLEEQKQAKADLLQAGDEELKKMSKSLGNVISIDALLERHSIEEVRWFYATQHYRAKLPFSWEFIVQGAQGYARIKKLVTVLADKLRSAPSQSLPTGLYMSERPEEERVPRLRHQYLHGAFGEHTKTFLTRFIEAMDDDLNTPNAVAAMFDYVSALYTAGIEQSADLSSLLAVYRTLVHHLAVFGIEIAEPTLYPELIAEYALPPQQGGKGRGGDEVIDKLLTMRKEARANKDFAKGDAIRNLLLEAGVVLEDTPQGPRWSLK